MRGLDETALETVVERIRQGLDPAAIFLYGSYAYGEPDQDSDVDLLVVVDDVDEPTYELEAEAYRLLSGLGFPAEIRVVSSREFDQRANWVSTIEREVKERGIELYVAS